MEENKKLDDFIRKSIKEVGLESPSVDFTDVVLSKIQVDTQMPPVLVHKPMFSKSAWLLILTLVAAIFAYVIFGNPDIESTWLSISQLNKLAAFNLSVKMPDLPVSNTFMYGFLIFTFFALIQVFVLKQRFDKHYSLG